MCRNCWGLSSKVLYGLIKPLLSYSNLSRYPLNDPRINRHSHVGTIIKRVQCHSTFVWRQKVSTTTVRLVQFRGARDDQPLKRTPRRGVFQKGFFRGSAPKRMAHRGNWKMRAVDKQWVFTFSQNINCPIRSHVFFAEKRDLAQSGQLAREQSFRCLQTLFQADSISSDQI